MIVPYVHIPVGIILVCCLLFVLNYNIVRMESLAIYDRINWWLGRIVVLCAMLFIIGSILFAKSA